MLRLTIRQAATQRLLARIVEHDGTTVVLDVGERAMIQDAMQKVAQGNFVVPWEGQTRAVQPDDPGLLRFLALHYAASGHIVEITEHD